jgi:hypothetical protein
MAATTNGASGRERGAVTRATEPIGEVADRPVWHFTRAELDALSVHDDVVLKLADYAPAEDGSRFPLTDAPHWAGDGPQEGAAIAVWQMLTQRWSNRLDLHASLSSLDRIHVEPPGNVEYPLRPDRPGGPHC